MGRLGTADEIASAAVFLASDESSFITGIDLPVSGPRSSFVSFVTACSAAPPYSNPANPLPHFLPLRPSLLISSAVILAAPIRWPGNRPPTGRNALLNARSARMPGHTTCPDAARRR